MRNMSRVVIVFAMMLLGIIHAEADDSKNGARAAGKAILPHPLDSYNSAVEKKGIETIDRIKKEIGPEIEKRRAQEKKIWVVVSF